MRQLGRGDLGDRLGARMFRAVGEEFRQRLTVGRRQLFRRLGEEAAGGFGGRVGLDRKQLGVDGRSVEPESPDAMIGERLVPHDHDEFGAGGDRCRRDCEDGLARDTVLGLVAGDGPARLVAGGFLRLALGHRSRGEFGDRPAILVEVGLGFDQRDIGRLAIGRLEADLESAEHEIPIEGAAEAFVWQGVVGQGLEAYRGQHGTRRTRFDHVGLLGGRPAGYQPGTVVEAFEFGVLLGRDFLVGQRFPGHANLGKRGALFG